jgi:hypothetical protein
MAVELFSEMTIWGTLAPFTVGSWNIVWHLRKILTSDNSAVVAAAVIRHSNRMKSVFIIKFYNDNSIM